MKNTLCPHAKKCGGCSLQNMEYARQLAFKQQMVDKLLSPYCQVLPIIGMENPLHYRNKIQAAFGYDRNRKIISGIYQSSTHHIVPVDSCLLEDALADQIIVYIRSLLVKLDIPAYDERRRTGFLRHVLVKRGFQSGETMVVLVSATPIFTRKKLFLAALLEKFPQITTIVHNVNSGFTSLVLGPKSTVLYGSGYMTETLCGSTFRVSPTAFYQVNPVQTEILYNTALEYAALTGKERVLDAYCGVGTIGILAASKAKEVLGVESNKDAVRDAKINVKLNSVTNYYLKCADAGECMRDMAAHNERMDVVITDPPRAGCSRAFLESLCVLSPKRVVYVSCNPETLARDVAFLSSHGYRCTKVQPVDMFPFTGHVETVVLMSKVK